MRDLIRSIRRRASYLLWPARKDTAGLPPVAYQPLREARTFYLSRECALIGQAGPTLTATQRGTIRAVFDARVASWLRVEYPRPAQAQIFAAEAVSSPALSLAVVMPNYINNDPAFIDHDFAYHVARSAQDEGFAVSGFAADAITYGGTDDLAAELKRLDLFFASTRPDIVAIDGNYIPGGRALDAAALEGLKARLGFKVVAFVGDCNDLQPDYLGYWTRVADLSVIFHKDTRHYRNLSDKSTVLVCPALPFHEGTFVAAPQRDIDLS